MNWIEVTAEFVVAPDDWSPAIELFRDAGCPSIQELDCPPSLVGCLADGPNSSLAAESLGKDLIAAGARTYSVRALIEEDWAQAFRDHFRTIRIGRNFVIVPTWDAEFQPEPTDLVITLDPGQAFGTGDHPTTRMCLELLEQADLGGRRVADIGCGTGILSIGAVRLGAREVAAIDIEVASVQVARENAAQNGVTFDVAVANGLESIGEGWDVVVSNIISATLIQLAPQVAVAVVTGGKWIVSGVIHDNWADVRAAAECAGFVLDSKLEDPQWVAASFRRA